MGHAAKVYRGNDRTPSRVRASAFKRGYDRRWSAFRKRYLSLYPYCVDCANNGRRTIAREIHHKEKLSAAPERKFDTDNLVALCRTCHQLRTVRGE